MATTEETVMADAEQYFSQRRGLIELWIGVVAAPLAWALHLQVNYTMVGTFLCTSGWEFLLHVVTGITLLIAAVGMWTAWRNWRRVGLKWPRDEGGGHRPEPLHGGRGINSRGAVFSDDCGGRNS